ncbi:hypothetical protein IG631_24109 [Alternaria alternata]|nr:hypothetical protein IG631_24109 [Alternaria alternata]
MVWHEAVCAAALVAYHHVSSVTIVPLNNSSRMFDAQAVEIDKPQEQTKELGRGMDECAYQQAERYDVMARTLHTVVVWQSLTPTSQRCNTMTASGRLRASVTA